MKAAVALAAYVVSTVVAGGCSIPVSNFEGKTCATAADCPQGYTCALARSLGTSTCEILYPNLEMGTRCAGAGPAVYCASADCSDSGSWDPTDVRPVIDCYCVVCHAAPSAAGAPKNFRLDQYSDDTAGLLGAHSMASSVAARACLNGDMPPSGYSSPTAAQRELLAAWFNLGAPRCDGGAP